MGRVANAAVAARTRAQERLAALNADRAERDRRIEDAAAAVFGELDGVAAAGERRGLAVQAAQRAIAEAERVEREAVAAADERIGVLLAALRTEGLTVAQVAALVALPVAEVRRLVRAAGVAAAAPDDDAA